MGAIAGKLFFMWGYLVYFQRVFQERHRIRRRWWWGWSGVEWMQLTISRESLTSSRAHASTITLLTTGARYKVAHISARESLICCFNLRIIFSAVHALPEGNFSKWLCVGGLWRQQASCGSTASFRVRRSRLAAIAAPKGLSPRGRSAAKYKDRSEIASHSPKTTIGS